MKRPIPLPPHPHTMNKKIREHPHPDPDPDPLSPETTPPPAVLSDENLLYEILKHMDPQTLATVGTVNKQFHKTSQDERLWELICTNHVAANPNTTHLRSVVLALGGFRRLYSNYLWPLSKPSSSSSTVGNIKTGSSWPCLPEGNKVVVVGPKKPVVRTCLGKDEVQLSLSLLSIKYFEKMGFNNNKK